MSKNPGQWNRMKIHCQGHHLKVHLNGMEIINHGLDSKGEGKLNGLTDRPIIGHIGLQDHGKPNNLYFRNIHIREL